MTEQTLLQEASQSLGELIGYTVEVNRAGHPSPSYDANLLIRTGEKSYALSAEVVRAGSQTTITRLITRYLTRKIPKEVLIVTDYVSQKNAAILHQADVQYLDASGNCRIRQGGLFIHIQGQKRRSGEQQTPSAFRKSGLKVIYAILVNGDLANTNYRELADLTGVSHGTVGNVMRGLEVTGFVQRIGKARRRIKDWGELMNRWVAAYGEELKPSLERGRFEFEKKERMQWRNLSFSPDLCQWGGEPAAALLTDYLRPAEFTLYSSANLSELALTLNLRAARNGEIHVCDRFWDPKIMSPEGAEETVHPLLVYADLVASGEPRNLEVAKMIHESRLSRHQ